MMMPPEGGPLHALSMAASQRPAAAKGVRTKVLFEIWAGFLWTTRVLWTFMDICGHGAGQRPWGPRLEPRFCLGFGPDFCGPRDVYGH